MRLGVSTGVRFRVGLTAAAALSWDVVWAGPASAHSATPNLGIGAPAVLSSYSVLAALTVIWVTRRGGRRLQPGDGQDVAIDDAELDGDPVLDGDPLLDEARDDERRSKIAPLSALIVFALLTVIAIRAKDPFRVVLSVLSIWWFLVVTVTPLFGDLWSHWSPLQLVRPAGQQRRSATLWACGWGVLLACAFGAVDLFGISHAAAGLLITMAITTSAAYMASAVDPYTEFVARLAPTTTDDIGRTVAISVLVGYGIFGSFRHVTRWTTFVESFGPVGLSIASAVAMCVCMVVSFLLAKRLDRMMLDALVPLVVAVIVANDVASVAASAQGLLFVIWDPLGWGWRPFGPTQGIQVTLAQSSLDWIRTLAVGAGALWAIARLPVRAVGGRGDLRGPAAVVVAALGYVALVYSVGW